MEMDREAEENMYKTQQEIKRVMARPENAASVKIGRQTGTSGFTDDQYYNWYKAKGGKASKTLFLNNTRRPHTKIEKRDWFTEMFTPANLPELIASTAWVAGEGTAGGLMLARNAAFKGVANPAARMAEMDAARYASLGISEADQAAMYEVRAAAAEGASQRKTDFGQTCKDLMQHVLRLKLMPR